MFITQKTHLNFQNNVCINTCIIPNHNYLKYLLCFCLTVLDTTTYEYMTLKLQKNVFSIYYMYTYQRAKISQCLRCGLKMNPLFQIFLFSLVIFLKVIFGNHMVRDNVISFAQFVSLGNMHKDDKPCHDEARRCQTLVEPCC